MAAVLGMRRSGERRERRESNQSFHALHPRTVVAQSVSSGIFR